MKARSRGFDYHLSINTIREYKRTPIEKRLLWLYQINLLRKTYPKKIIELQDKFRQGKI